MMRFLVGVLTMGVLGAQVVPLPEPAAMERFTAKAVEMTSPVRVRIRLADITVTRWSGEREHQALFAALLDGGSTGFLDRLCNFSPTGTLSVIGGGTFTLRYAWQVLDRDGARQIFLAADQPISLAATISPAAEALTFLELRLDPSGNGEGRLSEAQRLAVEQARNLVVLREYDNRPVHLIEIRSLQTEKQRLEE
jgi:hypothetical protein